MSPWGIVILVSGYPVLSIDHIVNGQYKRYGFAKTHLRHPSLPFDSLPYPTCTICRRVRTYVRSVSHVTTKRKEVDHILWVWGSVPRALRARGSPAIKIQLKKNQHTDAILYNQASQICACVESSGKVQGHFLWDPGPINATISSQKNWFCYLNLPVTLYLGSKKVGCMINKWQFCASKLAKSANYASSAFFGKNMHWKLCS